MGIASPEQQVILSEGGWFDKMKEKAVITILGRDRPGIVASVAGKLLELECNIEDVSQTILQTEFAAIFIVSISGERPIRQLEDSLSKTLSPAGLHVSLSPLDEGVSPESSGSFEPFVVTTSGPDRLGLVAAIAEIISSSNGNITNMRAAFRGGNEPSKNVMIYEIDLPSDADLSEFRRSLMKRARGLDLDLSLQHRDIFRAIHRV